MSLMLTELSRLGRAVLLKEAAAAASPDGRNRDLTPVSSASRRPDGGGDPADDFLRSTKFRLILLLSILLCLSALTVSFLIDQWNGVLYALIGIVAFIIFPLIIFRIIMVSRAKSKQSLKLKKEKLHISIATLNYDIPANLLTSSNRNLEKLLAQCPELKKTSTNEMKIKKSSLCTLSSLNENLPFPGRSDRASSMAPGAKRLSTTSTISNGPRRLSFSPKPPPVFT